MPLTARFGNLNVCAINDSNHMRESSPTEDVLNNLRLFVIGWQIDVLKQKHSLNYNPFSRYFDLTIQMLRQYFNQHWFDMEEHYHSWAKDNQAQSHLVSPILVWLMLFLQYSYFITSSLRWITNKNCKHVTKQKNQHNLVKLILIYLLSQWGNNWSQGVYDDTGTALWYHIMVLAPDDPLERVCAQKIQEDAKLLYRG